MSKSAKVAISLPESVLKAVEKERKSRGETRSEFFRRAVEKLLKQEQEAKAVREYIEGYRAMPETADENDPLYKLGMESMAEEPWDETR